MLRIKKEKCITTFKESDVEVTTARPSPKIQPIHDVDETMQEDVIIELDFDDSQEPGSSNDSCRTKRKRRQVDYKEEDSDDDKLEAKKEPVCLWVNNLSDFVKRYPTTTTIVPDIAIVNQKINISFFSAFFKKFGTQIKSLSLGTLSGELLSEVGAKCSKLETLTIRETRSGFATVAESKLPKNMRLQLPPKLKTLSLAGPNPFLLQVDSVSKLLRSVSNNFEAVQYTYKTLQDLSPLLTSLKRCNLIQLKSLIIKFSGIHENMEEIVLTQNEIHLIASFRLPKLETLALVCGINEDVSGCDLEALLLNYASTLTIFTIAGNLHGVDMADNHIQIKLPSMPHLESFSFGSVYEFEEETGQDEHGVTEMGPNRTGVPILSLLESGLISVTVDFPVMPALQSLSLGNLIQIKTLCPKLFPDLRTLEIASTWTVAPISQAVASVADFKFPVFPVVRNLQLPDCMIDEFFVSKILDMFPAVKNVTMNLPSAKCLRHFFDAMRNSVLQVLTVKTSYDFKGILEYAFFGNSYRYGTRGPIANFQEDENYQQLLKLKNPEDGDAVFKEFIRYYAIELPVVGEEDDKSIVQGSILDLQYLKTLVIDHLPRVIKIPLDNKVAHNHPAQKFHPTRNLGFKEYSLALLPNDLRRLKNLQKFECGSNICVPNDCAAWNKVLYTVTEDNSEDCSDNDISVREDSGEGQEEQKPIELPPPTPLLYYATHVPKVYTGGDLPKKMTNLKRRISRRAAMTVTQPKIKLEKHKGFEVEDLDSERKRPGEISLKVKDEFS